MHLMTTPFPTHNLFDLDPVELDELVALREAICIDVLSKAGLEQAEIGTLLKLPDEVVEQRRRHGAAWYLHRLWRLHRRAMKRRAAPA